MATFPTFLTQELFEKQKKALAELEVIEKQINDRVDDIIKLIHDIFGQKQAHSNWTYQYTDDSDGSGGMDITFDTKSGEVRYCLYAKRSIKLETAFWDYGSGFPGCFLNFTNSEIKDYIKDEIKRSDELNKQLSDKDLAAVAWAKLSPKERKVLGLE